MRERFEIVVLSQQPCLRCGKPAYLSKILACDHGCCEYCVTQDEIETNFCHACYILDCGRGGEDEG